PQTPHRDRRPDSLSPRSQRHGEVHLAQVFGVDVDYFFNDLRAHQIQKQFLALQQLRESGVKIEGIAARGEGLNPDLVMEAIRALRRDSDDRR
ncbi:hypothetical protein ACI3QN_12140, partial [Propionibacterium freudenreichii]|uniref:hypothetical protein n=1 Tax=Propionibacterium freudenreichii TaxID=1744 RepID=UPI003851F232